MYPIMLLLCIDPIFSDRYVCVNNGSEQAIPLTLRERLSTHKVLLKTSVFYLNYHKISIKSYVVDVY